MGKDKLPSLIDIIGSTWCAQHELDAQHSVVAECSQFVIVASWCPQATSRLRVARHATVK